MTHKSVSTMATEARMEEMLLSRGYHAIVQYIKTEVEICFNLDDAVVMTLSFFNTITPDEAVRYAASMMDKLNGKVSA